MTQKDELRDRVQAKKKEIEARIHKLKADSRSTSRDEAKKLERKLDELSGQVKGGWDDLSEDVAAKLNDWLKKH